jgi:hypothetical protein
MTNAPGTDPANTRAGTRVLASMFLLAMSLLILEIATTRLLSVAMAYHYAVLSISLAMLGLAVGGVIVYVSRQTLERLGALRVAAGAAVLFGVSTLVALLALLGLPVLPVASLAGLMNLTLLFLPQCIPYLFAGTAMAILLATFPQDVSRVYAADLVGAAVGCALTAIAIPLLTGPGSILLAAAGAAMAGWLLAGATPAGSLPRWLMPRGWAVLLAILVMLAPTTSLFEMTYVKGKPEIFVEKVVWTAHSRLSFFDELVSGKPFGWGFGAADHPGSPPYRWRRIQIDGMAETPILRGPADTRYLLWDVTSFPYLMKEGGHAMVIGSGGGRDIVASQTAGAWTVEAVEINEGIVDAMRSTYAEFSGGVYHLPMVTARTLDGRAALEQAEESSFDLIQMSAVDTWAAGSSGALALMENGLYTVEAFGAALKALAPDGYLSVSRFRYGQDYYGETVRMVAVAISAVERFVDVPAAGVSDHVLLVSNRPSPSNYSMATLIVKPTPLTLQEIATARRLCRDYGFGLLWPPSGDSHVNPAVALLNMQRASDRQEFYANYPIDVRPTWDDRPYFFHQTRLSSLAGLDDEVPYYAALRLVPMLTLFRLAVFLLVACIGLIGGPLFHARREAWRSASKRSLGYFSMLGLGFMFYEIPLVQKLTLGLGHPTRALTVVLFGLLIGTGLGSLLSSRYPKGALVPFHLCCGLAAVVSGIGLALGMGPFTMALFAYPEAVRVTLAAGAVLVLGVVLGTMFPLGVKLLSLREEEQSIAWCWAANGATGVMASVLGLIIGIEFGMKVSFLIGAAAYLVAVLLLNSLYRSSGSAAGA